MIRILVVEDEGEISSFLQTILEKEGMKVTICDSVDMVIKNGYEETNDIVVLDLMLRGERGETLVKHMRKKKMTTPILVLSAMGQIGTKVDLINLGADDYLTKPFDPQELVARVKSLYRRYLQTGFKDEEDFGEFTFYRKQNRIRRGEKDIMLTNREAEMFELLLRNKGNTVPLDDILKKIWKAKSGYHSNVVQVTARRLRQKVDSGFKKQIINNIHGIGYSLNLPGQKSDE